MRAMSRRTTRTRDVFSSCPVAPLEAQVELLLLEPEQLVLQLIGGEPLQVAVSL
jgi:hypothetical protein